MLKVLLLGGVGIMPLLCPDAVAAAPSVARGEYLVWDDAAEDLRLRRCTI